MKKQAKKEKFHAVDYSCMRGYQCLIVGVEGLRCQWGLHRGRHSFEKKLGRRKQVYIRTAKYVVPKEVPFY